MKPTEDLKKCIRSFAHGRFIPNPGNMGDCLIAKSAYDLFTRLNVTTCDNAPHIIYGGGGIWYKNAYKGTYDHVLEEFRAADRVLILPSSVFGCTDLLETLSNNRAFSTSQNSTAR